MQQQAAGGRHGRRLDSTTSCQNPTSSIDAYLFKQNRTEFIIYLKNNPAKFHPNPIWNDGALDLDSSDMGSVPDPE